MEIRFIKAHSKHASNDNGPVTAQFNYHMVYVAVECMQGNSFERNPISAKSFHRIIAISILPNAGQIQEEEEAELSQHDGNTSSKSANKSRCEVAV